MAYSSLYCATVVLVLAMWPAMMRDRLGVLYQIGGIDRVWLTFSAVTILWMAERTRCERQALDIVRNLNHAMTPSEFRVAVARERLHHAICDGAFLSSGVLLIAWVLRNPPTAVEATLGVSVGLAVGNTIRRWRELRGVLP